MTDFFGAVQRVQVSNDVVTLTPYQVVREAASWSVKAAASRAGALRPPPEDTLKPRLLLESQPAVFFELDPTTGGLLIFVAVLLLPLLLQ